MSIDLGNNPTPGNEATTEQKAHIRAALGLGDFATKTGSETLTNKTLSSSILSGSTGGQLDLINQQSLNGSSAMTRNLLRRELVAMGNNIQRFNLHRALFTRSGLNSDQILNSTTNTYVDTGGTPGFGLSFNASVDHTTWAQYDFGTCWMNSSSGASLAWNSPHSFALRANHVLFRAISLGIVHIGPSGSAQGGIPIGRGWGLCLSKEGYRLWSHDGTQWDATGDYQTGVITAAGHNFVEGDIIQFTGALTGGAGLSNTTRYFVINRSGNTFKLSNTLNGPAVAFTSNLTAAKIPKLPTYSSVLPTPPHVLSDFQANSNFLFVSNGLGTGSVFYGQYDSAPGFTPIGTISIPSSSSSVASMKMSFSSAGTYNPNPAFTVNVTNSSTSSNSVTVASVTSGVSVGMIMLGASITAISGTTITLSGNASTTISTSTPVTVSSGTFNAQTIAYLTSASFAPFSV
jgi:hypothetical protein